MKLLFEVACGWIVVFFGLWVVTLRSRALYRDTVRRLEQLLSAEADERYAELARQRDGYEKRIAVSITRALHCRARVEQLESAMQEIDRLITRRPPRRRWLALSRRVAHLATEGVPF